MNLGSDLICYRVNIKKRLFSCNFHLNYIVYILENIYIPPGPLLEKVNWTNLTTEKNTRENASEKERQRNKGKWKVISGF